MLFIYMKGFALILINNEEISFVNILFINFNQVNFISYIH